MTKNVRAKKHLGQHFLHDSKIAKRIVDLLKAEQPLTYEIGPGMGVLTQHLVQRTLPLRVLEIDAESVAYLEEAYPNQFDIIAESVLTHPFPETPMAWIGNLPYNISSPILFQLLELRDFVEEGVFMLQKEVAQRIATGPGSREYGVLSVLLQAYYAVKYGFTVAPGAFAPPPKVHSGVIRLERKRREDEVPLKDLARVVKTAFSQRRKMLGNALKPLQLELPEGWASRRAEQLSVAEFELLARL